jgi:2'-5' RNA ligase
MAEARVPQINQVLAEITASIITFTFTVEDLGAFPNTRRPNVIWVGIGKDNKALEDLHRAVNTGMEGIGFPAEKRKFTPHLTLGRINRRTSREDRAAIGDVISRDSVGLLGTVQVTELVLFQSILKPTGAEHYPLAKFALQS